MKTLLAAAGCLLLCMAGSQLIAQQDSLLTTSPSLPTANNNRLPFDPGAPVDAHFVSPGLEVRQSARYKKPASDPAVYREQYLYQIRDPKVMVTATNSDQAFLPKPFQRTTMTVVALTNRVDVDKYNENMLLEEQVLLARKRRATYLNLQVGGTTLGGDLRLIDSYYVPVRLQIHPPLDLIHPAIHGMISLGVSANFQATSTYEQVVGNSFSPTPLWEHYLQVRLPTKGLILGYRYSAFGRNIGSFDSQAQWLVVGFGNEARGNMAITGFVRLESLDFSNPMAVLDDPANYGVAIHIPLLNIGNGKKRLGKRLEIAAGQRSASTEKMLRTRARFGLD